MTKPKQVKEAPVCKFCAADLKDGKCEMCGGWSDSLGHFHRRGCSGGFHEECEEPKT